MKHLSLFILLLLTACAVVNAQTAQDTMKAVTGKLPPDQKVVYDKAPEFPGGYAGLSRYISNNIKYPPVARLIGIDGKVYITFSVDAEGKVVDAKPIKCAGAGCEAEAVDLITRSPLWKPGILNGNPVKVQYTLPIAFKMGDTDDKVKMSQLRKSPWGFIFQINGQVYDIDAAEKILGPSFRSGQITEAEPYPAEGPYVVKNRKETFILLIKDI